MGAFFAVTWLSRYRLPAKIKEIKNMELKHQFKDAWMLEVLKGIPAVTGWVLDGFRRQKAPYIGDALVKSRIITFEDLCAAIKTHFIMTCLDLKKGQVNKLALLLVPEKICRKYRIIPFQIKDDNVEYLTSDPFDLTADDDVRAVSGRKCVPCYGLNSNIESLISDIFNPDVILFNLIKKIDENSSVEILQTYDTKDESLSQINTPVIKMVNALLAKAVHMQASDIHIEHGELDTHVRYRIDGIMRNIMSLPRYIGSGPLVSRIKIMSNLDLAEHNKPQDGRARLLVDKQGVDLRVSVLPTSFGEKVVLRILNANSEILSIEKLEFADKVYQRIIKILAHEQGFVLVTGPTGSGKTTTLYAMLSRLKGPDINITTIEDPVEYRMQGVNQVQVNEKQGLTFASILRSVLRQDPDIILVGEIRDAETADIAFQSAMTGHLVFSTLHTNDTVASITRLVDLGLERFKIASALIAITSQRLVRKLCPHCKQLVTPEKKNQEIHMILSGRNLKQDYYEPTGCVKCDFYGYKGRISIVELLEVDSEIKELISGNASEEAIKNNAKAKNLLWTISEDAILHLAQGDTSLDEVLPFIEKGQEIGTVIRTAASEEEAQTQKPVNGKKKILIVEDDQSTRLITKKYLEEGGYEVLKAGDGREAIDIIAQTMPDLILLDLMMPKLDGIGVIKRVRQTMGLIELPIIVLTVVSDAESQNNVLNLGADDYIVKPFNPKLLVARVNAFFRRLENK